MYYRSFLLCVSAFLGFSSLLYAQVGINTTTPRTTLEVAGNTNIDGEIKINVVNPIEQGDEFKFLGQMPDNFIKDMPPKKGRAAFGYFQEYVLTLQRDRYDVTRDEITDFNTMVDTANYRMVVMSAYFNAKIELSGDAIDNSVMPYVTIFAASDSGNPATWRIRADYPGVAPIDTFAINGVWTILTLILPKSFAKELPQQDVNMGGESSGTAITPIID